jgi:hypothetical protein
MEWYPISETERDALQRVLAILPDGADRHTLDNLLIRWRALEAAQSTEAATEMVEQVLFDEWEETTYQVGDGRLAVLVPLRVVLNDDNQPLGLLAVIGPE